VTRQNVGMQWSNHTVGVLATVDHVGSQFWYALGETILQTSKIHNLFIQYLNNTYFSVLEFSLSCGLDKTNLSKSSDFTYPGFKLLEHRSIFITKSSKSLDLGHCHPSVRTFRSRKVAPVMIGGHSL
jgi:hypothetical protein